MIISKCKKDKAAVLLLSAMLLTGCGGGQENTTTNSVAEPTVVTEVQTSEQASSEEITENQETATTEQVIPQGKTWQSHTGSLEQDTVTAWYDAVRGKKKILEEQLGGLSHNYSNWITIGQKDVAVCTTATLQNHEAAGLAAWKVRAVSEDRVYEDKIVKNLLGNTAKAVYRELSREKGDSDPVLEACGYFYADYSEDQDYPDPNKITYNSWTEENDYYIHTYEGQYNGVDCQLMIGYRKDRKMKYIALGPKNWGDMTGAPEYTEMDISTDHEAGIIWQPGEDYGGYASVSDLLADTTNRSKKDRLDLAAEAYQFMRDKAYVKLPDRELEGDCDPPDQYNPNLLMVFFKDSERGKLENIDGFVNGYAFTTGGLRGQTPFYYFDDESKYYLTAYTWSSSTVYVTDQGVIGFSWIGAFDFEECLDEDVTLLSYDKAMSAFEKILQENMDESMIDSDRLTFYMDFTYYMVPTDDPEVYTCVPVWYAEQWKGRQQLGPYVVFNAADGSLISYKQQ